VTLAYLPYSHWTQQEAPFNVRRQNIYMRESLSALKGMVNLIPLLGGDKKIFALPEALAEKTQNRAYRDTQYSTQREDVDTTGDLYHLRLTRNIAAAKAALAWMQDNRPDVAIVPNGSIIEFSAIYDVACYLGVPVITYEFGEQEQRIWMAQNAEVMRQETDELWAARGETPLTPAEDELVRTLFSSRQGAHLWKNFARQWQGAPKAGGQEARQALGLDSRPIAIIPTNVLGDSLTLDRQLFSGTMTEWLKRTVEYFSQHDEAQLVIRIHPGEQIGWGASVYDILAESFAQFPQNVHLIPADAKTNTYDLMEIADLAIVYTTTTGMEMAMSGKPVIVIGQTHYRGKGFTIDPATWDQYFDILGQVLANPKEHLLTEKQIELAWRYAYRFFFEYPMPYPWHVQHLWDDIEQWPLEKALSEDGWAQFGDTFRYLVADPIQWSQSI
jgi:hypothetical protein